MNGLNSFIDTRQLESGAVIDADLCIIGGGAAGITIAREFIGTDKKVVVLETGGLNHEQDIQALANIENVGRHYDYDKCRLRYFGGTTNHWGGHCVRMEAIDFTERSWIPDSGWPFGLNHLNPFYDRAHDVIEIGGTGFDAEPVAAELGYKLFPFTGGRIKTTLSRYNRQRFGIRFAKDLDEAPNIFVYLYATVTNIDLDADGLRASHLTVKTLAGNEVTVNAPQFVLATGGIENARLLLDSNDKRPEGLGNSQGLVGRYFMEHISYPNGFIQPQAMEKAYGLYTDEREYEDGDRLRIRCHIALTQRLTQELQIPKFRSEIGLTSDLYESFQDLRHLRFTSDDVMKAVTNPVTFWNAAVFKERPTIDSFQLMNYFEQVPNRDSTVTLSEEKNALGQRYARLDWRLSELDRKCVREAHKIIAHEVGQSGFGRYNNQLPDDEDVILEGARGGYHHMATTRMSDDPSRGVVDRNCRLHDVPNIHVAGSSVFPTAGWPNPTLTIVALALRLSDHLKMEI